MIYGLMAFAGVAVFAGAHLFIRRLGPCQYLLVIFAGFVLFLAGVTGPHREQLTADQRAYKDHMRACIANGERDTECWVRWQMRKGGGD